MTDITIISKCGKEVEGLKELEDLGAPIDIIKLRNVGRCDHSFAYWMKHNREKIDKKKDGENLVLFTKDNPRQMADYRSFEDVFITARITGFSCVLDQFAVSKFIIDSPLFLEVFDPLILHRRSSLDEFGKLGHSRTPSDVNYNFKSDYEDLRDWRESLEIVYPETDLIPACFGGMFMVQKKGILKQPQYVWDNIEINLSRESNLEEGHLIERAWAGILLPLESNGLLHELSSFVTKHLRYECNHGDITGMTFLSKRFVRDYMTV